MKITVTRASAPSSGGRPDLYIATESSVAPDWPTVREHLLRKQPDIFDGYNDMPTDWATDLEKRQPGELVDVWLITAKED